ncbi:hypothetical protein AA313_de0208025 [Arthrobotrys entomopaga]|nr:hypothetical protein AA313_de0208025 [Arthrobotrys entomopaga]
MSTAAQRALLLPEILSLVLEWVHAQEWLSSEDMDNYPESYTDLKSPNLANLARCARVNKLWFEESICFLWKDPNAHNYGFYGLRHYFERLEPERRQFYANYVEECMIEDVQVQEQSNTVLLELEYPNLKKVKLRAAGWFDCQFPKFGKNSVRKIEFDPRFDVYPDTYGVRQDEMKQSLDYIAETFPDLETLDVIDRCLAYPGDLESFARRMPKLKSFDHRLVWVGHGDPPPRS